MFFRGWQDTKLVWRCATEFAAHPNSTARLASVEEGSPSEKLPRYSNNAMLPFRCLKTVITPRPNQHLLRYVHNFPATPQQVLFLGREAAVSKHWLASPSLSIPKSHTRAPPS